MRENIVKEIAFILSIGVCSSLFLAVAGLLYLCNRATPIYKLRGYEPPYEPSEIEKTREIPPHGWPTQEQ